MTTDEVSPKVLKDLRMGEHNGHKASLYGHVLNSIL